MDTSRVCPNRRGTDRSSFARSDTRSRPRNASIASPRFRLDRFCRIRSQVDEMRNGGCDRMAARKYQEDSPASTLHRTIIQYFPRKPQSGELTSLRTYLNLRVFNLQQSKPLPINKIVVSPDSCYACSSACYRRSLIPIKDSTGKRSDFCKASFRDDHIRYHVGKKPIKVR